MDHNKQPQPHRQRNALAEQMLAAAGGSGRGGGQGRMRTAVGSPEGSEGLSSKFNRAAAKPELGPKTEEQRQLLLDLRDSLKHAVQPSPSHRHNKQASRKEIAQLLKKLSTPKVKFEPTPSGMVSRDYDHSYRRQIVQEVNRQRQVLKQHHGKAQEQFNKASGIRM